MQFPIVKNLRPADVRDRVIAVDLGGSNVRIAIGGFSGAPAAETSAKTAAADGASLVAELVAMCRDLAASADVDWSRVASVAVGVPGVVAGDGALSLAPNLPPFGEMDVARRLAADVGVPVIVDNDVNMATLAEQSFGLGVGVANFIFIAVGTGVGMGVVSTGRLQRGANGAAGEIAYLPVGADPFDRDHHEAGPLETMAGGAAIARRYAELAGVDIGVLSGLDVYSRAADGDPHADAVLDDQARSIALAVVSALSIVDPALVAFGGGIGSREDFVARVRGYVGRLTPRRLPIAVSNLGERAGLLGAMELARMSAAARGIDDDLGLAVRG